MHRLLDSADEVGRIVPPAGLLDPTLQVSLERLVTPRTFRWVRNRCERAGGAVRPRVRGEVDRQRAVPAHAVPKDGLARGVDGQARVDEHRG